LTGKKCYACYHNKNSHCDPCPTLRCIQSGRTERDVVPGLEGSPIEWLELFSYPMKDPQSGKVTGVVEFVRDITERNQAELKLQMEREKLTAILESMKDGVYIVNKDYDIQYVNPALQEEFGLPEGKKCHKYFHDSDEPCAFCKNEDVFAGKTVHWEWTSPKNGKTYDLIDTPLKNADGSVFKLEIFRDISELKQASNMLQQERDRAQTYLDVAAVAMIALDNEGRITLVNRQGLTMLGYSEGELLGKDWFATCIPDRLRSSVRDVYKQLIAGEVDPVKYYENPILTKGGEERLVAWHNVVLLDDAGNITGTLSSGQDITERVRAEEKKLALEAQLRQGQKLESIGTLASGVAHEINNPLTGMINYADLIVERVKDDELRRFAQGIIKEGNRVAEIVKNLLYFSRQEKQNHSPARMEDIIDAPLTLVGAVLRKDQIAIEKEIPEDLPQVRCRSQQIEQVIINLLTNARDALNQRYEGYHEDKLIKLTVRTFERDGVEWIRTTVEDHGIGIPEDVIERIFDPFFTTKPRDVGTGLGLSVSYGIVKEHHGELTVESEPGKYTRFHLDLRVDNGWSLK
ncbi:MAG TPA: PAS domain S-box protein, partial [Candidatus Acetothermia bacterium]|nr:PAS domain S-box protein [Candidatus Acetothermia bacterium]